MEIISRHSLINDFLSNANTYTDIYIDSPFCAKKCKFCIYDSCVNFNKEMFNNYYRYVVNYLKEAEFMLKAIPIQNIYFGGGTASLMTTEIMEEIINAIPNFHEIPFKTIEVHATMLTDEKVDLLIKHKFTLVSVAVQTFNEDILKEQNRIGNYNIERMKRLIKKMKDNGISVSMDFLAYMTYMTADEYTHELYQKDTKQLEDDIVFASEYLKPSVITIYPNYIFLYHQEDESMAKRAYMFIKTLKKIDEKIDMYLDEGDSFTYQDYVDAVRNQKKSWLSRNFRYYDNPFFEKNTTYTSTPPRNENKKRNLFAIGGLRGNAEKDTCFGTLLNCYNYYTKLRFDENNEIEETITIKRI